MREIHLVEFLKYISDNNYGNTYMYTKLHWSEFDRYLLVQVLSSIVKWSSGNIYNPLPKQINGEWWSVPKV